MPIVSYGPESITTLAGGALPEYLEPRPPGYGEILTAAFRQGNILAGAAQNAYTYWGTDNDVDMDYNPWNAIAGTKYEQHWEQFAYSNNPGHTAALKRQIDIETADRRTMAAGGWFGMGADIVANILDPTVYIPVGGEIIKAGQGIYRIADVGLRAAIAGGVGTTLQETILHGEQATRTGKESAHNIGAGIVLSGLLGSGVAALLSRGEREAAVRAYDALIPEESGGGLSAASASQSLGLDSLSVAGTATAKIAQITQKLSPNLRLNFSPSPVARQVAQELSESNLYQVGHAEGITTGAAVSRSASRNYDAWIASSNRSLDGAYREMKKAGGKMRYDEFAEAVGRAMRNSDAGENEFISKAAREIRSQVIDPSFAEGKNVGIYDENDGVKYAASYFPRQYRKRVMIAKEVEVKAALKQHMEGVIAAQYREAAEKFRQANSSVDQEIADLNLSPEDRARTMQAIQQQLDEIEELNPEFVEKAARINELRRAKSEGYKEEIAAIQAEGGEDLAKFTKSRAVLRTRLGRVDFGYAGLESRQRKIAGMIEQQQDANQRSLRRLVARGQAMQKLRGKLDPAKIDQQLSSLRSTFADLIQRSNKAQDRLAKSIERYKASGDPDIAKIEATVEAHAKAEASRAERLTRLSERIEKAEGLDPAEKLRAAEDAIDELVADVADVTAVRAERAAKLIERQKALDPARIGAQAAKLIARKTDAARRFLDTWEIRNLGQNIDPFDPGALPRFKDMASEIIDDWYSNVTGRNVGSSASIAPEYMTPIERGPVRERTLPIPDKLLTSLGILEDHAGRVLSHYSRVLAADIELTRKFGDARMDKALKRIEADYDRIRKGMQDEGAAEASGLTPEQRQKASLELQSRQESDVSDLLALRDLIRGTYKAKENSTNFARAMRSLGQLNFIRSMGGVLISNLSDLYRPAMVHGLRSFIGEGVAPLMGNMAAVRLSVKEAQLAGLVVERVNAQRMVAFASIADPMERGTPVERFIDNMTRFGSKWTGLNVWTDGMKAVTSIMSQNRILNGTADRRTLAFLGINPEMEAAIRKEFAQHGQVLDGVHIANTEKWANREAVRAYQDAVGKDVDSIIVTPGVGDVPLFAHTPMGRIILQFHSFMFAAHQKVLMRGLQEGKARFILGMIGMTTLGMLSATLKAWRGGRDRNERFQEYARNPGYLIGEGIDNAGLFTLAFDLANTAEKLAQGYTGFAFNPIKTPLSLAGQAFVPDAPVNGISQRYSSRGPVGALGGPTAGLLFEELPSATMGMAQGVQGKEVSDARVTSMKRLLPYNSFLGFHEILQYLTDDSPYAPAQPAAN